MRCRRDRIVCYYKGMSEFTDEAIADKEVIKSLLAHIKELRSNLMSRIIKDAITGKLYRVEPEQIVTPEEVNEERSRALTLAEELAAVLPQPEVTPEPVVEQAAQAPAPVDVAVAPTVEPIAQPQQPEQVAPAPQPAPVVLQ